MNTTNTDKQVKVFKVKLKRKSHHRYTCNEERSLSLQISSKESMLEYNATTYTPITYVHDNTCVICFDTISSHNDKHFLHCGHNFHCKCIKQWLTRSNYCPVCKSPSKVRCVDNNIDNNENDNGDTHSLSNHIIDIYEFIPYDTSSPSDYSLHNDMFHALAIFAIISFVVKIILKALAVLSHKLFN